MSGECKGWSSWDRFKEAGVVDEHIDFSDNKVVVDNVLGRTRDTVGMCFAIDAAVAYTLSKAGPDADLTVQDMVNEYTRTAAAMMNGRVGYGYVYQTGHLDGEHSWHHPTRHPRMMTSSRTSTSRRLDGEPRR